jgi:hypothetical protein
MRPRTVVYPTVNVDTTGKDDDRQSQTYSMDKLLLASYRNENQCFTKKHFEILYLFANMLLKNNNFPQLVCHPTDKT